MLWIDNDVGILQDMRGLNVTDSPTTPTVTDPQPDPLLERVGTDPTPGATLKRLMAAWVEPEQPLRIRVAIQLEEVSPYTNKKTWNWWTGVSWLGGFGTGEVAAEKAEAFRADLDAFIRGWFAGGPRG